MNFFEFVKENKVTILLISIIGNILLISIFIYYMINYYNHVDLLQANEITDDIAIIDEKEVDDTNDFYVEIKGAVKEPGVYKVDNTNIINDLVILAGGLNKKAYTKNINLSKKLSSEMVVYIYTESEYKKLNKKDEVKESTCECPTYDISNCIENKASEIILNENITNNDSLYTNNSTLTSEQNLININTASKEELMTLSGIGESKALDIINYRTTNGYYKTIDEIKNVSGIGNAIYEKIKDSITV